MNPDDLFTPKAAGEYIGGDRPIKPSTLQFWRSTGKGPMYKKLSWKEVRYSRAALDEFLANSHRAGGSDRVEALRYG